MPQTRLSAARLALAHNNRPLYERVPTRDEEGRFLSDFMMLLPGLRDQPQHEQYVVVSTLNAALLQFREVVFADLNVPLNLLWISARPRPGVILDIAAGVKLHVPGALLVAAEYR